MRNKRSTTEPGLRHLAFFEALADAKDSAAENAAKAGLLTLRLIDHWQLAGATMVEPESMSIASARNAIMEIPKNDAQREMLLSIVNTMQTLREVDFSPVIPRIFAYAGLLEQRGVLALAADCYETVLRFAEEEYDADLVIDSHMRLGYCRRTLGLLNEAEFAYSTAGRIAKRKKETMRVLRSQIGLANVVRMRGNLPKADEMFSAVVEACHELDARDVESLALQDQATVALHRHDFNRAVCLGYSSLKLSDSEQQREKIFGDLGAFFVAMGRREAARDALLLQEAVATTEKSRVFARINLLSLSAREGDAALFAGYRKQLEATDLPPDIRANFLIESARGLVNLGAPSEAATLLEEARVVATTHDLNRVAYEAEEMLSQIHVPVATTSDWKPMRASAPAARVEQELRKMALAIAN